MLKPFPALALIALLAVAGGCKPPATSSSTTPETTPPAAPGPPGPAMDAGTGGLTATPELDAKIALLEGAQKKDGKALSKLYASRGVARMNDQNASPRVKYRAALKDYRTALKYDPANKMAKEGKDLIEGIYKSMGRPVPE